VAFTSDDLDKAIASNDLEAFEGMLDAGADVNMINGDGWPAVFSAILAGRPEFLRALIARGADLKMVVDDPAATILAPTALDLASEIANSRKDSESVLILNMLREHLAN
jgi:ankyrin repeat protein